MSSNADWLMHINIQAGLTNKIIDLQIFLEKSNIKVISINEHWLKNDQIFILNKIPNFSLAAAYCRKHKKGGGTCILVHNSLGYVVRRDLDVLAEDGVFEMSCIEICALSVVVLSLYRAPDYTNCKLFLEKLECLLVLLHKEVKTKRIYIAADFNVDLLKGSTTPKFQHEFLNLIRCYGFFEYFDSPTRIARNSHSCIDNILSNTLFEKNSQPKLNLELGISDHRAVFVCFKEPSSSKLKPSSSRSKKRVFTKTNREQFSQSISGVNWSFDGSCTTQQNFDHFYSNLLGLFNQCFPPKSFKTKLTSKFTDKSWVTLGIRVSSIKKRELHSKAKRSKDLKFLEYVVRYKKLFKKVCNASKLLSNNKAIQTADDPSKAAWNVVKNELGMKKSMQCFSDLKINSSIINSGPEVAHFLNSKFSNISKEIKVVHNTSDSLQFFYKNAHTITYPVFKFSCIYSTEVEKTIRNLKNKRACGWDELPVVLLKDNAYAISKPLCSIINQSFLTGQFPSQLKLAEVVPILKKGDPKNPDNYRPVSILPVLSKVFEKIASNQILSFFENNNIFSSNQFGFRPKKSTVSAAATLVLQIVEALDASQKTMGVFCDLSRAFDCMVHEVLLGKLQNYGFSTLALDWMKSYLLGRKQRVKVLKDNKTFLSGWQELTVGVPQGSILGPILFIIYVNDIDNFLKLNIIQYADDTTAVLRARSVHELKSLTENVIKNMTIWFKANGLKLNCDKTQIVKFQTARSNDEPDLSVQVNGEHFNSSSSANFLGLILDQNLNWKAFIQILSNKLNSACYQMYVIRDTIDLKTRLIVYNAYFNSISQYGIEIWGSSSDLYCIFKIQKRIIRTMTHSSFRATCKSLFQNLGILTIPCLYIYKCLIFIHNNFNSLQQEQHQHHHYTRHRSNFQYPCHRLQLLKTSPQYMGKKFYNLLPLPLKSLINTNRFKTKLKDFLVKKAYYSIEEYVNHCE